MMQSAQLAALRRTCPLGKATQRGPIFKRESGDLRARCLHASLALSAASMRSPSRDVMDDREQHITATAVDWRQAAAARQPGQRPGTRTPTASEEPAGADNNPEGLHRSEQETIALYKSWVRRGEHRDVVWKNGLVKLGDQLVRIKNGQVTIVSPPSKKVGASASQVPLGIHVGLASCSVFLSSQGKRFIPDGANVRQKPGVHHGKDDVWPVPTRFIRLVYFLIRPSEVPTPCSPRCPSSRTAALIQQNPS